MMDFATWLGIAIGAIALAVTFLAYRTQQGRKQLEYIVTSNTSIVPSAVSSDLDVSFKGQAVRDASITVIRLVNTGNIAVAPDDFVSDLALRLDGVQKIVSALSTKTRPSDLEPELAIEGYRVFIRPLLLNSEDMIELQLLTSGQVADVIAEGRLVGVKLLQRRELPYPPGSGAEGELLGFDKFMWYFFMPIGLGIAVIGYLIAGRESVRPLLTIAAIFGVVLYAFILNPMYVRYLIKRRRLWRP